MAATINALGNDIPPMFIFPQKNYKPYMLNNAPVGSLGAANSSGWMTTDLFVDYLDHFKKHTKCSPENPVLLILDNHASHISLAAVEKSRTYGIVMLTIHPHTSHKLQPLDKGVFGPFKQYYNKFLDSWMKSNPGTPCTIYNVAGIAKEAYNIAFSKKNMESAFKATGVFRLNRDIYTDEDFLPAEVTNRPDPTVSDETQQIEKTFLRSVNPPVTDPFPEQTQNLQLEYQPVQMSNTETNKILINRTPIQNKRGFSNPNYVSPFDILPVPKALPRKRFAQQKNKKKSLVITSTPEKERLAANLVCLGKKPLRRRREVGNKDKKSKTRQDQKKSKKLKHVKKKAKKSIVFSSSSEESVTMTLDDSSDLSEFNDENICCICSELYCKDVEDWIKCSCIGCLYCNPRNAACSIVGPCKSWAHEACTDDTTVFKCQYCKN